MRLSLIKLCQFADRLANGNPTLVGIFSRMAVGQFPTHLDPCFLAVEIETEPHETGKEVPVTIRLIEEDGRILTNTQLTLVTNERHEPQLSRTFIGLPIPWDHNFEFVGPGTFRFDIVVWEGTPDEEILGGETLMVHALEGRPG